MTRYALAIVMLAALAVGCAQEAPEISGYGEGDPVPSTENIEYLQGDPVTFDGTHEATIIEFWATWCAPCKESAPMLTALQEKYGDQGLLVAGFSDEEDAVVKPYLAEFGQDMAYTVGLDPDGIVQKAFIEGYNTEEINGIPWAFLIDSEGTLVWKGHPMDEELEAQLKSLLDESGGEA